MSDEKSKNIFLDEDGEANIEQLKKHMEKYKVLDRAIYQEELPAYNFDLTLSLSNELKDFGLSKDFNKIGWAVKYKGNVKIKDKEGNFTDMTGSLGYVVGESNNRIIMNTNNGYFGWISPEDYEIINLVHNGSTKLN